MKNLSFCKSLLYSYSANLKRHDELRLELFKLDNRLENIKAVNYNADGSTSFQSEDPRFKLYEKKERLKMEYRCIFEAVRLVQLFLSKLDAKENELIQDVFIHKKQYLHLTDKYYYSERQLKKVVNRIIDEKF